MEAFEGFGDCKVGIQVISTVRYAGELCTNGRGRKVLQNMIDRLNDIETCYGMEENMDKTKGKRI